eukprot:1189542-Prorocentrum_minimum.AAC.6
MDYMSVLLPLVSFTASYVSICYLLIELHVLHQRFVTCVVSLTRCFLYVVIRLLIKLHPAHVHQQFITCTVSSSRCFRLASVSSSWRSSDSFLVPALLTSLLYCCSADRSESRASFVRSRASRSRLGGCKGHLEGVTGHFEGSESSRDLDGVLIHSRGSEANCSEAHCLGS